MGSYSFGYAGGGDLRGNDKYAHLKVRPETPEDEARLEALRRMNGGEDIWLDVLNFRSPTRMAASPPGPSRRPQA